MREKVGQAHLDLSVILQLDYGARSSPLRRRLDRRLGACKNCTLLVCRRLLLRTRRFVQLYKIVGSVTPPMGSMSSDR